MSESSQEDQSVPETTIIDRSVLAGKSHDELVEMILKISPKVPKQTSRLDPNTLSDTIHAFNAHTKVPEVGTFRRLPSQAGRRRWGEIDDAYRIILTPFMPGYPPLGIEVYDDIFIGRESGGIIPDLDLNEYGGAEAGLSRQHALLRPTKDHLYLLDMESTNGTFCNGKKLEVGEIQELNDRDIVSFGTLHFTLHLVKRPD